jgi:cleavage stimulation factor subunit 3
LKPTLPGALPNRSRERSLFLPPPSFLLNFEYAETQEIAGNSPEVHSTYEKLFDVLRRELEALEARIGSAPSTANNSLDSQTNGINGDHTPDINTSQVYANIIQGAEEKPNHKSKELAERRTEYGLAIIMYMRFCNRAENLQSFRNAFKQARKDRWTPWEVYEAAALMEYHCTKAATVATKIFEKGLEIFPDEIDFVLRYLGFLISINDETSWVPRLLLALASTNLHPRCQGVIRRCHWKVRRRQGASTVGEMGTIRLSI